jgi:hypothetical protein
VEGQARKQNGKIAFKNFKTPKAGLEFLPTFQKYYGRHLTAKQCQEQKNNPEAKTGAED